MLAWAVLGFLHAIEVSKANQFLLRTMNPSILAYVLRDLFSQKWGLAARLALIVSVSASLLWIVMSAFARSAIVRVLVEQISELSGVEHETHFKFRSLLGIQSLRLALLWIGGLAYLVFAILSGLLTSADGRSHSGAALLVFLLFFGITAALLSFFNWILHLAPIYAVRDGRSFADATLAAWRLVRSRSGSLTALNCAHLALRIVWFIFMSGVVFVPLGFERLLPKAAVFLASVVLTLIYSAVADALFVARYAGYIEIAEQELNAPRRVPPLAVAPAPAYATSSSNEAPSAPVV